MIWSINFLFVPNISRPASSTNHGAFSSLYNPACAKQPRLV
jgi:hypothetical protein